MAGSGGRSTALLQLFVSSQYLCSSCTKKLFQLNTFSLMALHQLINHTNFTSVLCETCTKYTVSVSIDGEKRPRLDTGVGQAMESSQREFQHPSTTPHLPSVYHPPYVFHLPPTTYFPSTISSTFLLPPPPHTFRLLPQLSSIY